MKLKTFYTLALVALSLSGCVDAIHNGDNYWDLSVFRFQKDALKDNEKIRIIYSNAGLQENSAQTFYFHVIAISQRSGERVNILTTINNGITKEDTGKTFVFYDQDNIATKVTRMNPDDLGNLKNVDDIDNAKIKKISRVARNPKFDFIAKNNYPTVIGLIGSYSKDDTNSLDPINID